METRERETTRWRRETLRAAGYSKDEARVLAELSEVDLHEAVALVAAGCPSATAFRIIQPV